MTTLALIIGLIVVNLWQPGVGMNVDPATLDTKAIATYTAKAGEQSTVDFLLHIIPRDRGRRLRRGRDPAGAASSPSCSRSRCTALGERGKPLLRLIDQTAHVFFGIVGIVMKVAPIGAFGAMAFTIGKYGVGTLLSLGKLMLAFYATCLIFIFGVLGGDRRLLRLLASSSSSATSRRSC